MKSCSTCLHSSAETNGQIVCRFNPPIAFPMPQQGPLGQVRMSMASAFPPVSAEMWCSKHAELKQFDLAVKGDAMPIRSVIQNGRG